MGRFHFDKFIKFNNKNNNQQQPLRNQFGQFRSVNGHGSPEKRKHWQVNTSIKITPKKVPPVRSLSRDEIVKQRQGLPITGIREKIITVIRKEKTVIFIGETASGKTTQIPQFIHEAGISSTGMIAVTQPRRVAAVSIATRVAAERGCEVGQVVGYSVRFDESVSSETRIKYMTDGMLLREAITDPLLQKYNTIILDEAHERSIQTDVLFGIVKRCQVLRAEEDQQDLKLVIMSATMDVDHFSKYFNEAPVYYLEGRQFPITIHYAVQTQDDYVHSAIVSVLQVHREFDEGDILVFCTGQEEINSMVATIRSACTHVPPGITTSYDSPLLKLIPLPLHASLPPADQMKVFQPAVKGVSRKVIFATNVAETSLTIPGVKFVIDTCRMKARTFDPVKGFESLKTERISKAQADQRAGRSGREGPGTAYRLLTEEEYEELKDFSVPEILRVSLANVLIQLIAIGITDVLTFDFMDRPKLTNFETALEELKTLGAIEEEATRDVFRLTSLGQEMISFPLEPKYAKILVASKEFACTDEILTIISLLYVDNIFYIAPHRRESAADVVKKFASSEGDHIMLLNVYKGWQGSKFSRDWCVENFIHIRNMEIVREVRKQLARIWFQLGNKQSSCGANTEQVRRCLFSGLQNNAAILQRDGVHRTIDKKEEVFIHPSSCLFHSKPEAIIYTELVDTSKHYMRNISLISIEWLAENDSKSAATS